MKRRVLAVALSICLCFSLQPMAYASTSNSGSQNSTSIEAAEATAYAATATVPSPAQVYEKIIALKQQAKYAEGTTWTDATNSYSWKGGKLDGKVITGTGCVAFAFELSDTAFGNLSNRMFSAGKFKYTDIKVGDILRMNTDTHTVIVIEVSDFGVVVAEGNYGGRVHWGRTISKDIVMRDTSHYITRYPEGYVSPTDPNANVSIGSGKTGALSWSLTKAGTLTITGKGAMPDYTGQSAQPWYSNSSKIRKVELGSGVTSIGNCAFYSCSLLSIDIPNTVTKIGNEAFRTSAIIIASIPSSVKTIGNNAFRGCQNLSSVVLAEGVQTIGDSAFSGCDAIGFIQIPSSVTKVGSGAFLQCQKLTEVEFCPSNNTVQFGDNVFMQCWYLMKVLMPKKANCIGDSMFMQCLSLPGVQIPNGVTEIKASAFSGCNAMQALIIPSSVTDIGMNAFTQCTSLYSIAFTGTQAQWNNLLKYTSAVDKAMLNKATIQYNYAAPVPTLPDPLPAAPAPGTKPSTPSNPGNSNNDNADGTTPDDENGPLAKGATFAVSNITYKVTSVGKEVALTKSASTAKSANIYTVKGPDDVTYKVTAIGANAFKNNKFLSSLTIGANVKSIGASAFSGCKKLSKVTVKSAVLKSVGSKAFKGTKAKMKVKVPKPLLAKYKKLFKKGSVKAKQVK